ncbi:MAG: SLC13 family permease [Pseudomonadota bacterium]
MTTSQGILFAILGLTLIAFIWGRFRHDVVAIGALIAVIVAGLVPADLAFSGFGHPAVVTVACVLILSQSLHHTGAIDVLARNVLPATSNRFLAMLSLMAVGGLMSGFMNNVGAMALLLPIAVQLSERLHLTPGQVLMPLAFSTILGGMTTLIGTPPNLIVAGFRQEAGMPAFGFFDFTPVGLAVALAGIAFVALIGWRLVPARRSPTEDDFETGAYFTEVRVPEDSPVVGMTIRGFEREAGDEETQVVGLVRNNVRLRVPHGGRKIDANDVLILEAEVGKLSGTLGKFRLSLEAEMKAKEDAEEEERDDLMKEVSSDNEDTIRDDGEVLLREMVVLPNSILIGRSAASMQIRTRYNINVLAFSREGKELHTRLRSTRLATGDVLLLQGSVEALQRFASETGSAPLSERDLRLPAARHAIMAGGILVAAVLLATFGILPAPAAFMLGSLAAILTGAIPLRQVYTSIDWPVIVLLAALIPVAGAMQSTGAAELLAGVLVSDVAGGNAIAALVVVLVTTMFLSDVMNNAATAAVMCPIAIGIAAALDANPDAFLMAVAIGASCAFLTPIGHQNNTLILGAGGFRFSDYWPLGLPLEVVVVAVSVPLLLIVWPL